MRDHGPGVDQSRREIAAHLVPRLVHLASDHAVHGDALEDDLAGEVDRHLAVGDAEQLHPPPQAHRGERLVQGRRHARHLTHHVGASPPVSASTARTTSSRVASIVTLAPIRVARASRLAFTSEAITLAAPAARAIPTAKQPMGPHPTTNTVLPEMSAVSTV